jgi:hypothetical protein
LGALTREVQALPGVLDQCGKIAGAPLVRFSLVTELVLLLGQGVAVRRLGNGLGA